MKETLPFQLRAVGWAVDRRLGWALTFFAVCSAAYGQRPQFEIVAGGDRPVCHAYVSALKSIASSDPEFKHRPWCGGDLNPSIDGFPLLRRDYITDLDEAFTLHYRIQGFLYSQNQFYTEKRSTIKDREGNRRETERAMKGKQLAMWRYDPPIDIDNDGKPDHLLWYRANRCDSSRPIDSALLIVDPTSLTINENETRRLFADPRPYPAKTHSFIHLRAGQLGVFRYQGLNYIYAWGDDVAWTKSKRPQTTARVYLRQSNEMTTACEVRWNFAYSGN